MPRFRALTFELPLNWPFVFLHSMRVRERSRSPRRQKSGFQLLRLMLAHELFAERLVAMLDIPTRCSLLLVAKQEHALFDQSLTLVFQEYYDVVLEIFKAFPTARYNPQPRCFCSSSGPGSLTARNGVLAELCVFHGYPKLALLFLGIHPLPDPQWAAVIAVVMNRPQVFAESRLWTNGIPILDNLVALARAMDRQELIPLLPAQAAPDWHRCEFKPAKRFKDPHSQLVQCIHILCCLAAE